GWPAAVANGPRVGRPPADPDGDLLGILGMEASTREVRLRSVLGEDAQWNTFGLMGWNDAWSAWRDYGQLVSPRPFTRLGHPEWRPRIGRANFADTAWPFAYRLVSEDPVTEQGGLS